MVATRLKFNLDAGDHVIDLNQSLSEYHRKLHRQKVVTTVYGGFIRNNQSASAKFSVAPLTWTAKAAVNRAFKQWRKMISQTLQNKNGLTTGKWNDFKIHLTNAAETKAYPRDQNGARISPGEWDYSTLHQPRLIDPDSDGGFEFDGDMDEYDLHLCGAHQGSSPNFTSVGLIRSWYDSRPGIDSTGTPVDVPDSADPLSNLFAVEDNDNEKVTVIQSEGDLPPYARTSPFGMAGLSPVSIADNGADPAITPVGNQVHGFQALCGLVSVTVSADSGTTEVFLDVESVGERF